MNIIFCNPKIYKKTVVATQRFVENLTTWNIFSLLTIWKVNSVAEYAYEGTVVASLTLLRYFVIIFFLRKEGGGGGLFCN